MAATEITAMDYEVALKPETGRILHLFNLESTLTNKDNRPFTIMFGDRFLYFFF